MATKKLETITQGRGDTRGSTFRILERTEQFMIQEHIRNGKVVGYEVGEVRKVKPSKLYNPNDLTYDWVERPWTNEDIGKLVRYYPQNALKAAVNHYKDLTLGLTLPKPHTPEHGANTEGNSGIQT